MFPEIVLRGLTRLIPGLRTYVGRAPRPVVDGGYYTKTRENRPLIGPTSMPGAYVIGALSGYGLMAACGAAELLAAHVLGRALPEMAPAFLPSRYADPDYARRFARFGDTGQL
jgi:glycine/D-amino acid oxidase-like deaminating enzyme